jgi:hypothetical protein
LRHVALVFGGFRDEAPVVVSKITLNVTPNSNGMNDYASVGAFLNLHHDPIRWNSDCVSINMGFTPVSQWNRLLRTYPWTSSVSLAYGKMDIAINKAM